MIATILNYVQQVIATLLGLVLLAERPGAGAAKRQEVIDGAQVALLLLPVPVWVKALFSIDALVGFFVDIMVALLNKTGWVSPTPAPTG